MKKIKKVKKELVVLVVIGILLISLTFAVRAEDDYNNVVSLGVSFKGIHVDNDNIEFNVNSPKNHLVYFSKKVEFSINSSEELKKIEYVNLNEVFPMWKTLCINCKEYGLNKNKKLTMLEGENNLIIRAIDKEDNPHEEDINFAVESLKPKILSTNFNNGKFSIAYTEENLRKIILVYGNDNRIRNFTKECTPGKNQICYFSVDLTDYENQPFYYFFLVLDYAFKEKTQIKRIKVDTIPPILHVYQPKENKYYEEKAPLRIIVSEKSKIEYMDEYDNNPVWRSLCSNCDEYGLNSIKTKYFTSGSHKLLIKASDNSGNFDLKSVIFNVD